VTLVVLAMVLVRARMLDFPLERDEGEYAYMGQLLLAGVLPYEQAANHKFPGTYLAYAVAMALFGETPRGVHLGLLAVNCGSVVLVFLLGRRLFGDAAGVAAAAAYALLGLGVGVLGFAAHMTHFVVLPVLAGLVLLWRAIDSGRPGALLAAGAALGASVTVRQTSLAYVAFAVVFWLLVQRRRLDRATLARHGAVLAAGVAAPVLVMLAHFAAAGALPELWRWTVAQALAYGTQSGLADGLHAFLGNSREAIGSTVGVWLLALVGGARLARERSHAAGFVAGLLAAGAAATAAGLFFRPHYFVQVLPAVALLAGRTVGELAAGWRRGRKRSASRVAAAAAVGLAFAYPIVAQAPVLLTLSPDEAVRRVYGRNPFPESVEIGRWIREHSSPGDTVAVLGSEPQIYFYARRRAATSFLYVYPLLEHHPNAHEMQARMAGEIEAAAPRFLVITHVSQSWGLRPDSDRTIIQWANRYVGAHYRPVGAVEIGRAGSVYHWGGDAAQPLADDSPNLLAVVYERGSAGAAAPPAPPPRAD